MTERSTPGDYQKWDVVSLWVVLFLGVAFARSTGEDLGALMVVDSLSQSWRIIIGVFLHASLGHLIANLAILLLALPVLEYWFGRGHGLVYLWLTSVAANFGHYLVTGQPAIGISGGVAAVVVLAYVLDKRGVVHRVPILVTCAVVVSATVLTLFIPTVASGAHIIGLALGAFAGFAVRTMRSGEYKEEAAV